MPYFRADYPNDGPTVFRCFVQAGPVGWGAYINDLRTPEPTLAFGEFVDNPETGKALVERMLPRFLDRNELQNQSLIWREVQV